MHRMEYHRTRPAGDAVEPALARHSADVRPRKAETAGVATEYQPRRQTGEWFDSLKRSNSHDRYARDRHSKNPCEETQSAGKPLSIAAQELS